MGSEVAGKADAHVPTTEC